MAYGGSIVVIPISLRPVISYKIHLADICTLWAPSSSICADDFSV